MSLARLQSLSALFYPSASKHHPLLVCMLRYRQCVSLQWGGITSPGGWRRTGRGARGERCAEITSWWKHLAKAHINTRNTLTLACFCSPFLRQEGKMTSSSSCEANGTDEGREGWNRTLLHKTKLGTDALWVPLLICMRVCPYTFCHFSALFVLVQPRSLH